MRLRFLLVLPVVTSTVVTGVTDDVTPPPSDVTADVKPCRELPIECVWKSDATNTVEGSGISPPVAVERPQDRVTTSLTGNTVGVCPSVRPFPLLEGVGWRVVGGNAVVPESLTPGLKPWGTTPHYNNIYQALADIFSTLVILDKLISACKICIPYA